MLRYSAVSGLVLVTSSAAADPGIALHLRSEAPVVHLGTPTEPPGEAREVIPELVRTTDERPRAERLGLVLEDGLADEARQPLYEPTAFGARSWLSLDAVELGVYARSERSELDSTLLTTAPGTYASALLEPFEAWSLDWALALEQPSVAYDGAPTHTHRAARQQRVRSEVALAPGVSLLAGFGEAQSLSTPDLLAAMPAAPLIDARSVELGARIEALDGTELVLSGARSWVRGEAELDPEGAARLLAPNTRTGVRAGLGVEAASWARTSASATFTRAVESNGVAAHVPDLVVGSGIELQGSLGRLGGEKVEAAAGLGARILRPPALAESSPVALLDATASARIGVLALDLELANFLDAAWTSGEAAHASDTTYTLALPLGARGFPIATPRTVVLELGVEI